MYTLNVSRLNAKYDQAMNNLGNILKDVDELDEAERLLETAVSIRCVSTLKPFHSPLIMFSNQVVDFGLSVCQSVCP